MSPTPLNADTPGPDPAESERLRRWRLVLGDPADGPCGRPAGRDARIDSALGALYDTGSDAAPDGAAPRGATLGESSPRVARWLGEVRELFPSRTVHVMQADALDLLGLRRMLLDPGLTEAVRPDVHLAAAVLALADSLPEEARAPARALVRTVTRGLEERLADRTRSRLRGALDRSARTRRPRTAADVDWHATIRRNLRHYVPERGVLVPASIVGRARSGPGVRGDVLLAVDQSGSMAASAVYAGVFASVLASLRTLRTRLIAFGTDVADLTDLIADPVDALFGASLGGGTDIDRALAYCERLITRPAETVLVLISDLHEGGPPEAMLRRLAALRTSGVRVVVLPALSDDGTPAYEPGTAAALAALDVPAFACSPDDFPDMMAAALEGRSLAAWAEEHGADGG
ncbi:VWA domain-containing protein [Nocardiopsis halophila]|uniref:VWA domain-containing protein n=1 Tax=Nocardiopsis halophila TaxID=141692 RepID=UPI0003451D65|nr:VWA domain-containing protein [Nocardiopsis halophila]